MDQNQDFATQWLESLSAERGASPGTLVTYRHDLDCYLAFLGEKPLPSVVIQDVRSFLHTLTDRAFSSSTISRRRSVVRSLHRFLYAEDLATGDPTVEMEKGKSSKRLPVILSIADVDRLIEVAHQRAQDASWGIYRQAGYARRAALLETLYASGMRVSEAVHIRADSLRQNNRFLIVKGKGDKERLVPLHSRAVEAISFWQACAKAYGSGPSVWVFHPTRSGENPLTRSAALKEIKEAAVEAGLSRPDLISPHKLRHSFATHLLSNGANLREIQELMGHADLGSTEIYTHVAIDRIKEMVFDLHPLSDRE